MILRTNTAYAGGSGPRKNGQAGRLLTAQKTMGYHQRQQHLAQALRNNAGRGIRLGKQTSNLFRNRSTQDQLLDVREFKPHPRN